MPHLIQVNWVSRKVYVISRKGSFLHLRKKKNYCHIFLHSYHTLLHFTYIQTRAIHNGEWWGGGLYTDLPHLSTKGYLVFRFSPLTIAYNWVARFWCRRSNSYSLYGNIIWYCCPSLARLFCRCPCQASCYNRCCTRTI